MRIVARSTLRRFGHQLRGQAQRDAVEKALDDWYDIVRKAAWRNSADVRSSFATVSIVSADRLVFNIKGNDFRLVVSVDYEFGAVWIKWIGSHADYDRIDVRTVEHDPPSR